MRTHLGRRAFSAMELHTLFSGYIYTDQRQPREQPKAWHFWLPLIAYYSGAYSDEIGQLTRADLCNIDGIPCFHFHTHGKLKSRLVPVHPHLFRAGLEDFLLLPARPNTQRLLHDLPAKSGRYSEKVRIWFSGEGERAGYMQKCQLPTVDSDGLKTAISSLRLNFEQQLRIAALQRGDKSAFNYLMGFRDDRVNAHPDIHHLAALIHSIREVNPAVSWQRFLDRH